MTAVRLERDGPVQPLQKRSLFRQLIRFAVSTALSAAMTVGLPVLLHEVFGVGEALAVLIAFAAALVVNFLVMRHFVFARRGSAGGDLMRYAAANLTFRLLEYGAFTLLFAVLRLDYVAALLIVLGVSTVLKFCAYRALVFGGAR